MRKRKSTLEQILNKSDKKQYVKHDDPLHIIENHVVVLLFISLMFLTMVFVFMGAPATPGVPNEVTGQVVDHNYAYEETNTKAMDIAKIKTDIASIGKEIRNFQDGMSYLLLEKINYFTILTYVFWIALFGVMISQKPHEERK